MRPNGHPFPHPRTRRPPCPVPSGNFPTAPAGLARMAVLLDIPIAVLITDPDPDLERGRQLELGRMYAHTQKRRTPLAGAARGRPAS